MGRIIFYNVYNNSGICLPGVTKNVYSNLVAGRGGQKKKIRLQYVISNNITQQTGRCFGNIHCTMYIYGHAFVAVNKQIRFCYSKPSETGPYNTIYTLYRCIFWAQRDFERVVLLSGATHLTTTTPYHITAEYRYP